MRIENPPGSQGGSRGMVLSSPLACARPVVSPKWLQAAAEPPQLAGRGACGAAAPELAADPQQIGSCAHRQARRQTQTKISLSFSWTGDPATAVHPERKRAVDRGDRRKSSSGANIRSIAYTSSSHLQLLANAPQLPWPFELRAGQYSEAEKAELRAPIMNGRQPEPGTLIKHEAKTHPRN